MDRCKPVLYALRISNYRKFDRFGGEVGLLFTLLHSTRTPYTSRVFSNSDHSRNNPHSVIELCGGVRTISSELAKIVDTWLVSGLPSVVVVGGGRAVLCRLAMVVPPAA